jgi:hypothetical protein
VQLESRLSAPPATVWERVSTFEGINHELGPVLRMTAPAAVRSLEPADIVLGERIFRSWVLLFGVLPIDSTTSPSSRSSPDAASTSVRGCCR